jgi:hypothetical protein
VVISGCARADAAGVPIHENPVADPVCRRSIIHQVEVVTVVDILVTGQVAQVQPLTVTATERISWMRGARPRVEVSILFAIVAVAPVVAAAATEGIEMEGDTAETARVAAAPDVASATGDILGGGQNWVRTVIYDSETTFRPVTVILRPGAQASKSPGKNLPAVLLPNALADRYDRAGPHIADSQLTVSWGGITSGGDRTPPPLIANGGASTGASGGGSDRCR